MENKQKPNRRPFFRFIKSIIKIFVRKPKITYLGDKPEGTCIYLSNHSGASGPFTYEMNFKKNMRMWGTYEMCGNFKMRWKYLNYVYFHQKKKRSKFASFFLATILTPFMALFYKGMRIMPTYPDARLTKTIKSSIEEIENGTSILIFPENSSDGYHEILTEYFGGFWLLAKKYYEVTGKDIKIVDMYYHKKTRQIVVGQPRSFMELSQKFKDSKEVADFFLEDTNNMFTKNILPYINNKKSKLQ